MRPARRLFLALWADPDAAAALLSQARTLEPLAGRLQAPGDLHVTLCFLGNLDDAVLADLAARLDVIRADPFELEFTRIEYWPQSRVMVCATGPEVPEAARGLALTLGTCAAAAGVAVEDRPFRPHVTLLRGLPRRGAHPPCAQLSVPYRLRARNFHLAESQLLERESASASSAPRYRRLREWVLRGEDARGTCPDGAPNPGARG